MKLLAQFEYWQRRDVSSKFLSYVCSKEGFGQEEDKVILYLQKRQKLIVDYWWDPVDEVDCIFEQDIYLSVFYRWCVFKERLTDII